jgi:hypothetical protein
MRSRGFTCLYLGIWLAFGLCLDFISRENLRNVQRTMSEPAAALPIAKLGSGDAQLLLRFQVNEQNRHNRAVWENVQIGLALFYLLYVLFGTTENKVVLGFALSLVVIVMLQRFLINPEITGLGRLLDFVPDAAPSPHRARYSALQNSYLGTEALKWMVQLGMSAYFIGRQHRSSRYSRQKLNVVDKPDYGHVNR